MIYNTNLTPLTKKFLSYSSGLSGQISYDAATKIIAAKKGAFLVLLQRNLRPDGGAQLYSPQETCQLIANLGYPEGVRILASVLYSGEHLPETNLAAIYALTEINIPESHRVLTYAVQLLGKHTNPLDFLDDTEKLAYLSQAIHKLQVSEGIRALDQVRQKDPIWNEIVLQTRKGISAPEAVKAAIPQIDRLRDVIFVAFNRRLKLVEYHPNIDTDPVLLLVDVNQHNHYFFDRAGKAKLYHDLIDFGKGYFHPLPTRQQYILDGESVPAYDSEKSKFGFVRIISNNPDARQVFLEVIKSLRRDKTQHRPIVYFLDSQTHSIEACSDLLKWWQGYIRGN